LITAYQTVSLWPGNCSLNVWYPASSVIEFGLLNFARTKTLVTTSTGVGAGGGGGLQTVSVG